MKQLFTVFALCVLLLACTNPKFTEMQQSLTQYQQMISLFSASVDSVLADTVKLVDASWLRKRYEDSSVTWRERLHLQYKQAKWSESDKQTILKEWAQAETQWINVYIELEKKLTARQLSRLNQSLALINASDSLASTASVSQMGGKWLIEFAQETRRMNQETREMAQYQIGRVSHYRDSIVGVLSERKSVLTKQPEILIK